LNENAIKMWTATRRKLEKNKNKNKNDNNIRGMAESRCTSD